MEPDVLQLTDIGLYCAAGDFYIDPRPRHGIECARSVITHAHADHARAGSARYVCTEPTAAIMRRRISDDLAIRTVAYGESLEFGPARVSLHSAGHVLGSAQVRVEVDGEVWVVTGDLKRDADPTSAPFESVACDVLITEATFALPIFRWRPGAEVAADIFAWWQTNASKGKTSVLFCYAFGKAQRVLAELAAHSDETIVLHGAVRPLVEIYSDLECPCHQRRQCRNSTANSAGHSSSRRRQRRAARGCGASSGTRPASQVAGCAYAAIAAAEGTTAVSCSRTMPTGRGCWQPVEESGAGRVLATHGRADVLVRYLREQGLDADELGANARSVRHQ